MSLFSVIQNTFLSLISIINVYSNVWTPAWHQQNWHTPPITFLIPWHIYFTLMRWGFSNFLYNHPQLSVYLPLNCEQASHIFLDVWKRQEELFDVSEHVQSQCLNIVCLLSPQAYVIHMNGLQASEKVYYIINICLNCCSQRSFLLMWMPLWK